MNIIQEWDSKTGREQQEFIKACVLKAAKQEFGMSALYQHGHNIDEYISEVWIELTENRLTPANVERDNAKRERDGKAPITLASMIYKATRAVMSASIRHDRKADSRDGGELDPEQHKGIDTTADIIATLDFQNFLAGLDSTNRKICEMKIEGIPEREIGKALGISGPAVHKRIEKVRKEWRRA